VFDNSLMRCSVLHMTTTEIIAQAAERFEQYQADMALVQTNRAYLTRIGVTDQMIRKAQARIDSYKAL
jgi:hypothetical protein